MARPDKKQDSTQAQASQTAPPAAPQLDDLDVAKLDLSIEKVDERISPSETNVFDK